jgi:hypothetical protein
VGLGGNDVERSHSICEPDQAAEFTSQFALEWQELQGIHVDGNRGHSHLGSGSIAYAGLRAVSNHEQLGAAMPRGA